MMGTGPGSLQSLLALFPETLMEISVPQAGGGQLICSVFLVGEMAALAAALRLGGWQADERHQVAPKRSLPLPLSLECIDDLGSLPEDGLPESLTDFS